MKKILVIFLMFIAYTAYGQKAEWVQVEEVLNINIAEIDSATYYSSGYSATFTSKPFAWVSDHHTDTLSFIIECDDSLSVTVYMDPKSPQNSYNTISVGMLPIALVKTPSEGISVVFGNKVTGLARSMVYGRVKVVVDYKVNGCVSTLVYPYNPGRLKVWALRVI